MFAAEACLGVGTARFRLDASTLISRHHFLVPHVRRGAVDFLLFPILESLFLFFLASIRCMYCCPSRTVARSLLRCALALGIYRDSRVCCICQTRQGEWEGA